MNVPCIILAGGKAKPELQAVIGIENRALALVNGETMISLIVAAIAASESTGAVAAIGSLPPMEGVDILPDAGDFVSNVLAGATHFENEPYVLYLTADLPFLSGEVLTEFINQAVARAKATGAALVYPVVPVELCYARFPGIKRTVLKLREGVLTGGNVMLARPAGILQQREAIASAYAVRKSPLKLGALLGMGTLVRIVLSQVVSRNLLTVEYLEKRVEKLLGCSVSAILSESVELATDLDKPEDFVSIHR